MRDDKSRGDRNALHRTTTGTLIDLQVTRRASVRARRGRVLTMERPEFPAFARQQARPARSQVPYASAEEDAKGRRRSIKTVLGLAAVILFLAGCAATQQQKVQQTPAICGFLGEETCEELKPGAKGQAGLRYINPEAKLTQYDKVMIQMVGFFGSDKAKVSPKDQQMLTDLFQTRLNESLAKKFQVVDQAGPGVMKIEVALLDAEAATPGMRSITMVIPQARLLSTGSYAVTGKYPFAGGGQAAAKFTDSVSGEILGAAVDRRVGGGSITTAAQWQWGDAENVITAWSEELANGLYSYTSGARKP